MTQLYALTAQPLPLALHLASAAPEWYPCETLARIAQRLLRENPRLLGAYPSGTGLPAFKHEVLRHLAACGIDADPRDLLITNGATEAMQIALRAGSPARRYRHRRIARVLRPAPDHRTPGPARAGSSLRARPGMSLEALEYALEHHGGVRAVVAIPSFQNPLGACMSEAAKRRLLKIVQRHGIALIEDDVFGDLGSAAERPPAVKPGIATAGSSIADRAARAAPGFRLGWVLGGRHQRQLESLKIGSSLAAPLLEQRVLADYMKSGRLPAHLRRLRTQLAQAAASARACAQRHFPQGTRVLGPEGGWWLWLELPEPADTLALLRDAVSQGIAYTPGALFSAAGKHGHCLRLNVARPWSTEMAAGLERLGLAARLAATRNQAAPARRA